MTSVFYDRFERHNHGEGLKGHATHYCAGCGHGLIHKYLAEAIDELGIQDRTIAVSPVGCAVFLYYYMDVGNTQAPHGRAPAVAIGHKTANPGAIVVSYQGDGDLASIGLAEIMHAALRGESLTVIFINNAIYGMTGGQMAPTTLPGMKTTSSPAGRDVETSGFPIRICELLATMEGATYIARRSLHNPTEIRKAKKAIKQAFENQLHGYGFSLVELLSSCPTNWDIPPAEALKWIETQMVPVYPLGDFKNVKKLTSNE